MKKLTVIVPVYKVASYLEDCLNSLACQDYPCLEFILIDDGSPDESALICDKMALKDNRFIVCHKKNGGQSSARNFGLCLCKSDYVTFVDSDDYLLGQPYSHLMKIAEDSGADIVGMNFCSQIKEKSLPQKKTNIISEYNRETLTKHLFIQDVSESVWDKIFKRELFDELLFAEGVLNEDFLWYMELLAQRDVYVICTDYLGYFYRRRAGSTTSVFGHNMIDAVHNALYAQKHITFESVRNLAEDYLLKKLLFFLINMPTNYIQSRNSEYIEVINLLQELKCRIGISGLSRRQKVVLQSFAYFPVITKYILNVYFFVKKSTFIDL